jgi:PEP-CTERM/exosortase A-associated glycosyltransferase
MSLRVLHVLDHSIPLHSGYTFRTRAILNQQRALGWHTEHLTSPKHEGAAADVEEVDGLRFHRTRVPDTAMRRSSLAGPFTVIRDTRRRLESLIPELRPDVLHAHSPSLNGLAALGAARRFNLPLVYEVRAFWEDAAVDHGTTSEGSLRYRLSKAMETRLLKRADAVTVICEGLREDLLTRGIPASRITVIPNAVDIEQFPVIDAADAALRTKLGLDGALVLGFIGSFYAYEGLDLLLAALPAILSRHPEVRVLLVGGGFEDARLRDQATRLGIADRVVFTGRVPHAEVTRYYGLVDLLVYPRKAMRLTHTVTPLKPLEAMAQGRLLAASDVGGHRELIRDGETGYLFASDSPAALVDAVDRMLADRDQWLSIRAAGRRFVERERTWAHSVARYQPVYERVVRAGRGQS